MCARVCVRVCMHVASEFIFSPAVIMCESKSVCVYVCVCVDAYMFAKRVCTYVHVARGVYACISVRTRAKYV